jgi:type IV pilus assembly protein PilV
MKKKGIALIGLHQKRPALTRANGFTLIEILVALVILAIALLALAGLMVTTTKNSSFGSHMTEAATFAQDLLEQLRASPWANVVSGADQRTGSTGVNYNRNWNVVPNPTGNQRWVNITVNWNDGVNRSISLLSVISQ